MIALRETMARLTAGYADGCHGNISTIAAISALPLLLAVGAATDYVRSRDIATELQAAVDSAALSGAAADTAVVSEKELQASAYFAQFSSFAGITPEVTVAGDTVTVTAGTAVPTSFMSLAGFKEMDVQATATAVIITKPICVLALNGSDASTIQIFGSTANISASDCVVHSNSASPTGLDNKSNATSTAEEFCAVGGYDGTRYNPLPKTGCRTVNDPYAGLATPAISGCDFNNLKKNSGTSTLSPGVYCGGLSIGGGASVNFQPGVYIIKDGPLSVTGTGGQVDGTGVTFYFIGTNATLSLSGGATIDLAAPTAGPYAGFVFVQDAANPPTKTNKISGDTQVRIVGVVYFPSQTLEVVGNGDFGVLSPYMSFVADKLQFSGNGKLHVKLDPAAAGFSLSTPKEFWGTRLVN